MYKSGSVGSGISLAPSLRKCAQDCDAGSGEGGPNGSDVGACCGCGFQMTATAAVKGEIERFLKSSEPEVICISGEWGVGKTYTWQTILDGLRTRREIGLSRYSYVSLFGIASLDALKASIFENLEFLVPQGSSGFTLPFSSLGRSRDWASASQFLLDRPATVSPMVSR
jgi:hypothetical protein